MAPLTLAADSKSSSMVLSGNLSQFFFDISILSIRESESENTGFGIVKFYFDVKYGLDFVAGV